MKEIVLQSDFPCLIICENQEIFLSPEEKLTTQIGNIYVYPVSNKNTLPFKLDITKTIAKNYRIIEENDKLLCFLFSVATISKKVIEKQKIGQINLTVSLSTQEASFKTEEQEICLPLDFSPNEYSCHIIENFSCIHIKNKEDERLYIYNPSTSYLKIFKGKQFEFEKKSIIFTQVFCDVASTTQKKKLLFEKDNLTEEISSVDISKYYVSDNTLCYAFLDAILQENYALAKKFLTSDFSETSDEKFKTFFGNFFKFFSLSETRFLIILPNENKIISFKIENNLISEFEIE